MPAINPNVEVMINDKGRMLVRVAGKLMLGTTDVRFETTQLGSDLVVRLPGFMVGSVPYAKASESEEDDKIAAAIKAYEGRSNASASVDDPKCVPSFRLMGYFPATAAAEVCMKPSLDECVELVAYSASLPKEPDVIDVSVTLRLPLQLPTSESDQAPLLPLAAILREMSAASVMEVVRQCLSRYR